MNTCGLCVHARKWSRLLWGLLLVAGIDGGALFVAADAGAQPIPPGVVRLVEDGIPFGSATVHRTAPVFMAPDQKILALSQTRPEELVRHITYATNTIRILGCWPEICMAEQSVANADLSPSTNVLRYGWTPHFVWKHADGESLPWVVPLADARSNADPTAESIVKTVEVFRAGKEHIFGRLGLPWMGDAEIRHHPDSGSFYAKLGRMTAEKFGTNQVSIRSFWSSNTLELTYGLANGRSIYHCQIKFESTPPDKWTLASVHTYNIPEMHARPDPRALVESYTFTEIGTPKISVNDAKNPMTFLKWKEWLEFYEGRWITRNHDGGIVELPGFGKRPALFGLKAATIPLLIISSCAVCLLLARGIWKKMAKSKAQHQQP